MPRKITPSRQRLRLLFAAPLVLAVAFIGVIHDQRGQQGRLQRFAALQEADQGLNRWIMDQDGEALTLQFAEGTLETDTITMLDVDLPCTQRIVHRSGQGGLQVHVRQEAWAGLDQALGGQLNRHAGEVHLTGIRFANARTEQDLQRHVARKTQALSALDAGDRARMDDGTDCTARSTADTVASTLSYAYRTGTATEVFDTPVNRHAVVPVH